MERLEELREFVEGECSHGHGHWVEQNDDGSVEIRYVVYLDDGHGCYFYAEVFGEFGPGDKERITVDGYDAEDIQNAYDKLAQECPTPFECETCQREECEVFGDLRYLGMLQSYLEYLNANMPRPEF